LFGESSATTRMFAHLAFFRFSVKCRYVKQKLVLKCIMISLTVFYDVVIPIMYDFITHAL